MNFIEAAKKLGVNPITLFDPEDLVARKHDKMVVNCLLQLAKIAALKYKITPPSIIQYEIEIEELEQKRKAGTLKEDEDDLDDEVATTSTRNASLSVIAPPSPAQADTKSAAAPSTPSKEPEPTATASPVAAAPETPATPEPVKAAPDAAAASPAPADSGKSAEPAAAEAADADAGAGAGAADSKTASGKKKSDKAKYKYLPYVPNPDSEIDQAVAKVLNNNLFDISVKPVEVSRHSLHSPHRIASHRIASHHIASHRAFMLFAVWGFWLM